MKRPLLVFLIGLMTVFAFGQDPMIEVGTSSIDQTLTVGDSVEINVVITNVGNRDLEWEADRYAPDVTFVKEDYANPELSENQDRVSPTVLITRNDEEGLYNIFSESGFSWGISPENTLWAAGKTGTVPEEDYTNWDNIMEWPLPKMIGRDLSVFLTEYDTYLDLKFLAWTSGGNGGGFSYVRSGFAYWIEPNMVDDMPVGIEGTVLPTKTDTLTFFLTAKELIAGNYPCSVEIHSNDPNNPVVTIPIALTVTGTPEISTDASLDFGNVPIGASSTGTTQILNIGDGDLTISSMTNTESVFVLAVSSADIMSGSGIELEVEFTPLAESDYIDTIVIMSNDPVNAEIKIPISGSGIPPSVISVLKVPGDQTLVFGNTITDTLIIKNTGASDLMYELDFTNDSTPVTFTKENYADPTLEANQDRITSDVWITRGDKQGMYNAAIEDGWDNDLWDSPKGTQWKVGLTKNNAGATYRDWDREIDQRDEILKFDYSLLLPAYKRYFDLKYHKWTSAARGGGFSYTRLEVPAWISAASTSGTLAPGDSIINVITFDADKAYAGIHMANIVVTSNDPSNMTESIPVSLTITGEPEIESTPTELNFGGVVEADTAMFVVELMNTGSSVLTISGITNDSTSVLLGAVPTSIAPGLSYELMVKWVPDYLGAFVDTIYVASNDTDEAIYKVPISGMGLEAPALYIDVTELADTLVSGTDDDHDVVIKNTGASELIWYVNLVSDQAPVTFTKQDSADWTMAENQDRISPSVWITRAHQEGIFNIATENSYNWGTSPAGTQWSSEPIMSMGTFTDWRNARGWPTSEMVGTTMGMRLTTGLVRLYDVTWNSWTEQGVGGGFSYTRQEVPEWISGPSIGGTLAPGDSTIFPVNLSAAYRTAGVYNATIEVYTNIPGQAPVEIGAMIKVTGEPTIDVSPTTHNYGTVGISVVSDPQEFTITNSGADTLRISSMTTDSAVFTFDEMVMKVAPGEDKIFNVTFSPMYAVTYLDTIVIVSDASDDPMLKIPIEGMGVEVGDISVMPMMLTDVVRYNDTTTYKVMVKNEGGSDLSWEVQGYPVTFTKVDMADWTLEANQDRITSNVWLTRQNTQGLFNIQTEASYSGTSPAGTRWAFGYMHELENDDYEVWVDAINGSAQSMVDSNISLYLEADDMYYDVLFDSYSGGGPGGGFSYTRTGYPAWMESSDSGSVLASGDSVELTISFFGSMASIGENKFDLTFLSDDPDEAETVVELDFSVYSLMVDNELDDLIENVGFGTKMVDFADVFSSADGDSIISYIVANAYDSVATVAVSGTEITITEVATGTTIISVRAQTESGDVAYADFNFRVNNAPVVANPISNVSVDEGFATHTVDISGVFTDADGDALTLDASSATATVVTASVSGTTLTLAEVGNGTSTITVTADDGIVAAPTSTTFDFTVVDVTGLNALDANSFAMHPNPSQGKVAISFANDMNSEVTVVITNISGKKVYIENFNVSTNSLNLDLDMLSEGLYLVEIKSDGFYNLKKLIIER